MKNAFQDQGRRRSNQPRALDGFFDSAMVEAAAFGLEGLIYDYTPVPFTPDGQVVPPTIVGMRNMPKDMESMWFDGGLYLSDPVQILALRSIQPLYWSYHFDEPSVLTPTAQGAVANYLRDSQMARGLTVPVQTPSKGCATVTGFWRRPPDRQILESLFVAEFMLFAHKLHGKLLAEASQEDLATVAVRLTPREAECVRLCAEGMSDKQVAYALDRSISTVVMHLQSAMRKLGARNRAQAIARAAHYGILQ
ncbi:autoinducer binding domain-containing protein [Agrobacterium rhizogenes]|uniref:helix-turn-helix transcriptional regulator n=1 Tax=Rhizobium rhizogenes TaxID=359 RepID=UPI0022B6A252|nr:LuxR family transcriptional regulator [Rhizobium rhizogenes]MCZ7450984.1 autoinducer binding domain-containing protein [Rhizobium rhizogenes]